MPELLPVPMQQCERLEETAAQVGKYTVSRAPINMGDPEDWECTCPSFKYQRGLDDNGYCKHIRKYMEERCTWHQMFGVAQTEEQQKAEVCPECGGPTVWRSVGV